MIPFDKEFKVVWVECTKSADLIYHDSSGTFYHLIQTHTTGIIYTQDGQIDKEAT